MMIIGFKLKFHPSIFRGLQNISFCFLKTNTVIQYDLKEHE